MSDALTWQIVKKNNRYINRNGTGDRRYFSTEETNITKLHSFRASGLANSKAFGVRPIAGAKGVEIVAKNPKYASQPKKNVYTVKLTKGARASMRSVKGLAATSYYRPDLSKAAQKRVAQIVRSQKAQ